MSHDGDGFHRFRDILRAKTGPGYHFRGAKNEAHSQSMLTGVREPTENGLVQQLALSLVVCSTFGCLQVAFTPREKDQNPLGNTAY